MGTRGDRPRGHKLGEFEHFLLLAVLRLGEDAYGVTMRREIAERTGRAVTIGAIYPTMDRLEARTEIVALPTTLGPGAWGMGPAVQSHVLVPAKQPRAWLAS